MLKQTEQWYRRRLSRKSNFSLGCPNMAPLPMDMDLSLSRERVKKTYFGCTATWIGYQNYYQLLLSTKFIRAMSQTLTASLKRWFIRNVRLLKSVKSGWLTSLVAVCALGAFAGHIQILFVELSTERTTFASIVRSTKAILSVSTQNKLDVQPNCP